MRALLLAAILLAGCVGAGTPTSEVDSRGDASATTTPTAQANATQPQALVGERGPTVVERFLLAANHTLDFVGDNEGEMPEEKVREAFTGLAFYAEQNPANVVKPWAAFPARHPYEVTQDIEIVIRFTSDQPAATTTKGVISPIGGWIGTTERWSIFFQATDAPDTLEGGKVYTSRIKVKPPETGLFVREGESLALYTFLGYQSADNVPISYVVGGAEPATLALPHVHFNVSAPNESVILEKTGTTGPNPSLTTTQHPQPVDIPFDVPSGTAYIVATITGTGTSPDRYDLDLDLRSGATSLGGGSGPMASETVVLGPTALARANGKLVAHIGSANAGGGTFTLTVKAYGQ